MTSTEIQQLIKELDARDLLATVRKHALHRHVTVPEVLDEDRFRGAVLARHALWYELYQQGHWSFSSLGRTFHRSRDTITSGIRAHQAKLDAERAVPGSLVTPYGLEMDGLGHD
jgi:hypothetical protein